MFGETVDGIPHERFSPDDSVERAREIYERRDRAAASRRTRASSCAARSRPSSTRGTRRARRSTARTYDIPDDLGTAVNVVQMVFGNKGDELGDRRRFTRDPSTGEQGVYGEFLVNAQGEDVVAGIRTPQPLAELRERLPEAYDQLLETMGSLERHYRDMQDIEFTVEEGSSTSSRRAPRSGRRRRRSRRRSTWPAKG